MVKNNQLSMARWRDLATVLWIPATALGWSVGLLPSQIGTIGSSSEFAWALLFFSLNGLLVGVVTGLLQMLALRHLIGETRGWLSATILGFTLSEALGLFLAVGIPWSTFALHGVNTLSGSGGWEFLPVPFYSIFGGFMAGLFQASILKRTIIKSQNKVALLWILGTWLGIGLGTFAGAWIIGVFYTAVSSVVRIIVERLMTGTVLGLTTSALLFLIRPYQEVNNVFDADHPIPKDAPTLP